MKCSPDSAEIYPGYFWPPIHVYSNSDLMFNGYACFSAPFIDNDGIKMTDACFIPDRNLSVPNNDRIFDYSFDLTPFKILVSYNGTYYYFDKKSFLGKTLLAQKLCLSEN